MGLDESVADRLAIRELVDRYNDAVMRMDPDAWIGTWCEDPTWVLPGIADGLQGKDTILAAWKGAMDQFEFVGFFASAGPIAVDGDRATGTWYQQELLDQKDGSQRQVIGRYSDDYIFEDGQWRFQKRVYEVLKSETRPGSEGS